jgi:hypothetical protein
LVDNHNIEVRIKYKIVKINGYIMGNLIYVIGLACAIWVIYDVWVANKRLSDTDKIIWTILAVFFSIFTAIIYYFVKKR